MVTTVAPRGPDHAQDDAESPLQVVETHVLPDGVGPGMLFLAQRGDDVASRVGWLEELRPSVPRIRHVRRPTLVDVDVRVPLDALTGQSETDPAGDLGDRQRLVQLGSEHLPPRGRQAMWRRDVVGCGEELDA